MLLTIVDDIITHIFDSYQCYGYKFTFIFRDMQADRCVKGRCGFLSQSPDRIDGATMG
jgi:hypothetical protein